MFRPTIAQRVTSIEADLVRLLEQKRTAEQVVIDAQAAEDAGLELSHAARFQRECAELSAQWLAEQINEQLAARDALVPRPREAT